jgi:hypothetical protein
MLGSVEETHENEEDLCNPTFGKRTTGKAGNFRALPEKEVETPRKKGEPLLRAPQNRK